MYGIKILRLVQFDEVDTSLVINLCNLIFPIPLINSSRARSLLEKCTRVSSPRISYESILVAVEPLHSLALVLTGLRHYERPFHL
jgi:hypothetical protein